MRTHKIPSAPENYPVTPKVSPSQINNIYQSIVPGPNYCGSKVPVQSDLNIEHWKEFAPIVDKIDQTLIAQLECGFTMGIDYHADIEIPVTNHLSARQDYQVIDEFVMKHYQTGAILGPYERNPFPVAVKPSPMQVATSSAGKKRPVLDMSYPRGKSINDAIPSEWNEIHGFDGSFKLPTHDNVCHAIVTTPDPVIFISDFKSYYMQIPSDWADTPLMCFTWRSAIWLHRRLPFGCRSSCLHAQRVTDAVVAIFRARTGRHLDGYVDDMISVLTKIVSAHCYAYFHWLCEYLGLGIAIEKCLTHDVIRQFLGLLYNLVDMVMSLPDDKLHRVLQILNEWLQRETCTKAQTQTLLGHLNHLSAVVHAGRPFTARVVDILRESEFPAKVTLELKKDIQVWIELLTSDFACSSIIKSQDLSPPG